MRRRLIICGVLVLWASIASAQVLTPLPASGSLVSANDAVTGAPGQSSSIAIQLTGTWTGTVTFRASGNGGQTYVDVLGTSVTTGALSTTTTSTGMFVFANGGYDAIRAVFTTATSGTVLVSMDRGYAQAKIASPQFTNVTATTVSANTFTCTQDAIATTSTDCYVDTNTTAATSGATVQMSPRFRWRGNAWNTTASQTVDFFAENLPATAATPTGTWKLGYSLNGGAATYPFTVSSAGAATLTSSLTLGSANITTSGLSNFGTVSTTDAGYFAWGVRTLMRAPADGQVAIKNQAETSAIGLDVNTNGTLKIRNSALTAGTGNLDIGAKITAYNAVTTAGWGVPSIVAAGRVTAQSAANASISTYTVGAADGSFEVSANLNATVVTALSTTLTCTYTDEANAARTMILPVLQVSGTFVAGGAITGLGAWETPTMHIRAKAATAITILTSAGTFTGVTYTAEGVIRQIN